MLKLHLVELIGYPRSRTGQAPICSAEALENRQIQCFPTPVDSPSHLATYVVIPSMSRATCHSVYRVSHPCRVLKELGLFREWFESYTMQRVAANCAGSTPHQRRGRRPERLDAFRFCLQWTVVLQRDLAEGTDHSGANSKGSLLRVNNYIPGGGQCRPNQRP